MHILKMLGEGSWAYKETAPQSRFHSKNEVKEG